jgi:hypothetical protein
MPRVLCFAAAGEPGWPVELETHAGRSRRSRNTRLRRRPAAGNRSPEGALRRRPRFRESQLAPNNLQTFDAQDIASYPEVLLQFTNLRSRMLFTSPSSMKFDKIADPPALIKGRGIPVTGIRPTTIPTFTKR